MIFMLFEQVGRHLNMESSARASSNRLMRSDIALPAYLI